MRMMLKVSIPTDAGNKAIVDGTLPKVIGQFMERHKPEGAYFTTYHGRRTMFAFVNMPDPSQMPVIGEPLFIALGAEMEDAVHEHPGAGGGRGGGGEEPLSCQVRSPPRRAGGSTAGRRDRPAPILIIEAGIDAARHPDVTLLEHRGGAGVVAVAVVQVAPVLGAHGDAGADIVGHAARGREDGLDLGLAEPLVLLLQGQVGHGARLAEALAQDDLLLELDLVAVLDGLEDEDGQVNRPLAGLGEAVAQALLAALEAEGGGARRGR